MSDERAGELKRIKDELITFLQGEVEQRAAGTDGAPAMRAATQPDYASQPQPHSAPIDPEHLANAITAKLDPVIEAKTEAAVQKGLSEYRRKDEAKAAQQANSGGSAIPGFVVPLVAALAALALGFGGGYYLFGSSGPSGDDIAASDPIVPGTITVPNDICEWVADNRGQLTTYVPEPDTQPCADLPEGEQATCQARAALATTLQEAIASGEGAACAAPAQGEATDAPFADPATGQ